MKSSSKLPKGAIWRPIKTAPKDCLVLLSCNENPEYPPYVCLGRWIDLPHTNQVHSFFAHDGRIADNIKALDDLNACAKKEAHWGDGYVGIMQGSFMGQDYFSHEFRGGILFRPTHWMPLPKPPIRRKSVRPTTKQGGGK